MKCLPTAGLAILLVMTSGCRGKVSSKGESAIEKSLAIEKVLPEITSYRPGDDVSLKAVLNFRTVAQNVTETTKWSVADEAFCILIESATLEGQRVHLKSSGECSVSAVFEELTAAIALPVTFKKKYSDYRECSCQARSQNTI